MLKGRMKILHVFSVPLTPESFFDGQFRYLADEGGWELHLACRDSSYLSEFAIRNKVQLHEICISRGGASIGDFKAVCQLVHIIRKEKIDVVVGHTPKAALTSMLAACLCGVKARVYMRHGLPYVSRRGVKKRILKWAEMLTGRLATRIVDVSQSQAQFALIESLNPASKQCLFGAGSCGGIDAFGRFNPDLIDQGRRDALRRRLGIEDGDFVVGYCGRFCRDKGTVELIDGFRLFEKRHHERRVKLLLAGRFDAADPVPKRIENEISEGRGIVWVGYVTAELEYVYSLMDVFALPSRREGLGMSVLEAAAMRVPGLVGDVPGCRDTIDEHATGEFMPLNAEGVAAGLEAMSGRGLLEMYGPKARKKVIDNYEITKIWPKILNFYKNIESEL